MRSTGRCHPASKNKPSPLPASPGCVLRNLQVSIFKKDGATADESQPVTQIWTLQLIISQMPIIFAAAVDAPAWYSYCCGRRIGCIGVRIWTPELLGSRLVAMFYSLSLMIQKSPAVGNLKWYGRPYGTLLRTNPARTRQTHTI